MESGDAMSEVGTLKELGVQVGDVVEYTAIGEPMWKPNTFVFAGYVGEIPYSKDQVFGGETNLRTDNRAIFRIISRATPPLLTWAELTPAEKGALLLAHHQGEVIEWSYKLPWKTMFNTKTGSIAWSGQCYYRIKPQPKIKTVTAYYRMDCTGQMVVDPHDNCGQKGPFRITFQTIDGKPDCSSVKMEEV